MNKKLLLGASFLSLFLIASCGPSVSSSESSSSSEIPSSSERSSDPEKTYFDFYAVNDFHGSILEISEDGYYESGISKLFGHFKDLKEADPDHTFLISSGDMFQGSLESNYYYGHSVMAAMNEIGFDSMTIGNHEFDYGQDRLISLIEAADFPVLGGNIMNYENGASTGVRWEHAGLSTIVERGGIKVGIVGMIGEALTRSITSKYVDNLEFVAPMPIATQEATRLRSEEDCDIVILSIHDGSDAVDITANLKDYFDGIFCGHTHEGESLTIDGVPVVQGICNGQAYSHFRLSIKDGVVETEEYGYVTGDPTWPEDEAINTLMAEYIEDPAFVAKSTEVLGTLDGYLSIYGIGNLSAKSMYEKYKDYDGDGVNDLACAISNSQRATLYGPTFTYSDLYKCAPFMNEIVILKVSGFHLLRQAKNNCTYTGDLETYGTIDESAEYTIAVINYLAYHKNSRRVYDYFPSIEDPSNILAEYVDYPVDIAADYIKTDCGGAISYKDYLDTATGMNVYA